DDGGTEISADTLGPVTAADRGNVTDLLFREGVFSVPAGTREVVPEVVLDRNSGLSNEAFADEIRGRVYHSFFLLPSSFFLLPFSFFNYNENRDRTTQSHYW
ncbi:hypothetical protein, partial [Okeania sp. SIO2B9]|uniref:hypothetical protein n=1 Tax=Okeania sp. SIO2B9 TaxID=2607782 RepID=UPI001428F607